MLSSKWRVRSHRYLGTIYLPIIDLETQDTDGPFVPFSVCVDSGAAVSLLPRAMSTVLGLDPAAGRPIELSGAGHHGLKAKLYDLPVRLAGLPIVTVPFAIAEVDNIPGLLGRLGIFDRFEITFDPTRRETGIEWPQH